MLKVQLNQQSINGSFSLNENILDDTGQVIGTAYFCASSVEIVKTDEMFTPNQRFFINRDKQVIDYVDIINSDKGTFIELMVCDVSDGIITEMNVTNGGTNHVVGEKLTFDNTDCFRSEAFQKSVIATVSSVDVDGVITGVNVDRVGEGYIKLPKVVKIGENDIGNESFEFVSSGIGSLREVVIRNQGVGYIGSDFEVDLNSTGNSNVKIELGSIFNDGGNYFNQNSFLSNIKVIQDSRYYQSFSYVIESSLQLFKFKDLLKSLIHPAGTEMFSTISSENQEDLKMVSSSSVLKIPFMIRKVLRTYSDIPLNEFGSNMNPSISYDGGNKDEFEDPKIDAGGAGADPANFHISAFSSWDSIHQIYKHKYTNLKVGFNDKDCFKFEEVVGLKASIDSGQRDVSLSRTAFLTVENEGGRVFTSDDFAVGDVIFQGDDLSTATSISTVEKWDPSVSESNLELLKKSGHIDIDETFKVNSYTKNYLYYDTNVLDGTYDQINQKMTIISDTDSDIQIGDVLYQGESNNKTASATVVRVDLDAIIVTTTQGNFSLGDIKSDVNSSTFTYELTGIVDYIVLGTKNVSISNKILNFTNPEILFEIDDIVYQEDGSGNKITEGQIKTIFGDGVEVEVTLGSFIIGETKIDILNEDTTVTAQSFSVDSIDDYLTLETSTTTNKILTVQVDEDEPTPLSIGGVVYQEDGSGNKISEGTILNLVSNEIAVDVTLGNFSIGDVKIDITSETLQTTTTESFSILDIKDFLSYGLSNNFTTGEIVFQGDDSNRTSEASVLSWDSVSNKLRVNLISGTFSENVKLNKIYDDYLTLSLDLANHTSSDFGVNDIIYQGNLGSETFKSSVVEWDFGNGLLKLSVLSGSFSIFEPIKIRKKKSIFNISDISETITLNSVTGISVGDILYKGVIQSPDSLSTVETISGTDLTLNTTLGDFSVNDTVNSIKKYDLVSIGNSLVVEQNSDTSNNTIPLRSDEFIQGDGIFQGDSLELSTFQGSVSDWEESSKELRVNLISGQFDEHKNIKKILTNHNQIQSKEVVLYLNELKDDFSYNDFYVNTTVSFTGGNNGSGVVKGWNQNTGELDVELSSGEFSTSGTISGFSVNSVYKILVMDDLDTDIFNEKFSIGDVVYQGNNNNPTGLGEVVSWNHFNGYLVVDVSNGDFSDSEQLYKNGSSEVFNISEILIRNILDKNDIPFTNNDFSTSDKVYQGDFSNTSFEGDVTAWDSSKGELKVLQTSGDFRNDLLVFKSIDPPPPVNNGYSISNFKEVLELNVVYSNDYNLDEIVYQSNPNHKFLSYDGLQQPNINLGDVVFQGETSNRTAEGEVIFILSGGLVVNSTSGSFVVEQVNYDVQIESEIPSIDQNDVVTSSFPIISVDNYNLSSGTVEVWDSNTSKLTLKDVNGTFDVSDVVRKDHDIYEFVEILEVIELDDVSEFTQGEIFYQNIFDNSYVVKEVDSQNNKIYTTYEQGQKLSDTTDIFRHSGEYVISNITQDFLVLEQNSNISGFINFNQNDFILDEFVYQGFSSDESFDVKATVTSWNPNTGQLGISSPSGEFSVGEELENVIEYEEFEVSSEPVYESSEINFGDSVIFMNNDGTFDEMFGVIFVDKMNNQFRTNACSQKKFEFKTIFRRKS